MGLFNVLNVKSVCRACGKETLLRVQFKLGHCRQIEYEVGDELIWDDDYQRERRGHDRDIAGYVEACPECGNRGQLAVISLKDNKLVGIRFDDEEYERLNAIEVRESIEDDAEANTRESR